MKTLKLIAIGIVLLVSSSIHAQVSLSVNFGTAPSWGPVGYSNVGYYYLPDIEAYYDIRASQFIYFGGGSWVRSRYLPRQYRDYDLNSGYKVVLSDYHGSRPYTNFRSNREQYYRGYRGAPQRTIGEYRDNHRESGNQRNYSNQRNYGNRRGNEGHGNNGNGRGNEGRGNNGNGHGGEGHGRGRD